MKPMQNDPNTDVRKQEDGSDGGASAPEWFARAVSSPQQSHFVDSGGARIHYVSWNADDHGKPTLLLAHGMLGHTHWWDFTAPFFTDRFRVFALDLAGMGQSDHREAYDFAGFVGDYAAVLREIGGDPATVIGHSFGGSRLLDACLAFPELIGHAIVIDSYYGDDESEMRERNVRAPGPPRMYASQAFALSRFRVIPEQYCEPYLKNYVGQRSLVHKDSGWMWRFDPKVAQMPRTVTSMKALASIQMPVDYVYGSNSTVASDAFAERLVQAMPRGRGPVRIPCAGHHIMLEQPLALVAALNALLALKPA